MKKYFAILIILAAVTFSAGYYYAGKKSAPLPSFHDMRVNYTTDYTSLVSPDHPEIRSLASHFKEPEEAYNYVRDYIRFDQRRPAAPAYIVLREKAGSCLGKAILLCSIYRAMGFSAEDVRIVTGEVFTKDAIVEHAWLDLEYRGQCFQQDPTNLLGKFHFSDFPGSRYSNSFIRRESYCFNDTGFALVSQLNRFKGSMGGSMPPQH